MLLNGGSESKAVEINGGLEVCVEDERFDLAAKALSAKSIRLETSASFSYIVMRVLGS